MIKPYSGNFHLESYPKVASTAFAMNDLVYLDANGFVTPAVDGVALTPVGLIQNVVTSTDSDYADNSMVNVLVGDVDAKFLCDVSTGTAAQEDVGQWVDIDDANSIDVNASTYDIFFVTDFVSSSQVIAKMAKKSGAVVA